MRRPFKILPRYTGKTSYIEGKLVKKLKLAPGPNPTKINFSYASCKHSEWLFFDPAIRML